MALYYPGEMIADRYRVERELGSGGFGDVYEATDLRVERRVAIKVLKPDEGRAYKPATKARFEREARVVAQLQSPHTLTLLNFGESDEKLYMAFELIPGEDLRAVINREGRLDPDLAVHVLRQLLDSLGEAHRAGILHRDIKPANIRVFPWGDNPMFVKLLDFGLARPTDTGSPGITETGELLGTPRYMSPEQLRAEPLTPASDIYSLGVVFLEMLVGAAPLQGNRWSDQFDRMMTGHVFSFPELERISPQLISVMNRMTAREPSARFQTSAAVLHSLDHTASPPREPPNDFQLAVQRADSGHMMKLVLGVLALAGVAFIIANSSEEPPPKDVEVRENPLGKARSDEPAAPSSPAQTVDLGRAAKEVTAASEVCSAAVPTPTGWSRFQHPEGEGWTYIPTGYDPARKHPIMIVAPRERTDRWDRWNARTFADARRRFVDETKLQRLADDEGLLLIIPPAWYNWNASDGADVRRTKDHVDALATKYCVDLDRVYVVGDHLGATLAYQVSSEDWVAAIAIFGFVPGRYVPEDHRWWNPNGRATPVLHVIPTASKHVSYGTNEFTECRLPPGHESWLARWRKRYGCSNRETASNLHPGCVTFDGCAAPIVACAVPGGYHWPGTNKELDKSKCKVEQAAQIELEEVLWQFFRDKRRSE